MLPFVLLNGALSEPDLTVHERHSFIEISFYYKYYYVKELNIVNKPLRQSKYKSNKEIRMHTNALSMHFCNTALSILKILDTLNDTINLNRLGSNPVEHIFGLLRMKSRYKHTFEKKKKK